MNDASNTYEDTAAEDLGPEVELVEQHLRHRFPDADDDVVTEAIKDAAEATADARLRSFRPLLVEHRASDDLRVRRDQP